MHLAFAVCGCKAQPHAAACGRTAGWCAGLLGNTRRLVFEAFLFLQPEIQEDEMAESEDDRWIRRVRELHMWCERRRAAEGGADLLRSVRKLTRGIDLSGRKRARLTRKQRDKLSAAVGLLAVFVERLR